MSLLAAPAPAVLPDDAGPPAGSLPGPPAGRLGSATTACLLATGRAVVAEPRVGLLVLAAALYLALGLPTEARLLGGALLLVAAQAGYRAVRNGRVRAGLHALTQPRARVWRWGSLTPLPSAELVVGDVVLVTEGERLPAAGLVRTAHDFLVAETPGAAPVRKQPGDAVAAGARAVAGRAEVLLMAGAAGPRPAAPGPRPPGWPAAKTPLQRQAGQLVGRLAGLGTGVFALVCGLAYLRTGSWPAALLGGLPLALALLPGEILGAGRTFMVLGAARLSQLGALVRQPRTLEYLGATTVICADKTGTLTQEGMQVSCLYDLAAEALVPVPGPLAATARQLLAYACWASETQPLDPLEQAIAAACAEGRLVGAAPSPLVRAYPLAGTPPMMTQVRQAPGGALVVAGKGAPERVLAACRPPEAVAEHVRQLVRQLSAQGYRVLAVARGAPPAAGLPGRQDDFAWSLLGLVALANPPRANAAAVVQACLAAGIQVKLLTGDFPETAQAIARQLRLPGADTLLTGPQVLALAAATLPAQVQHTAVFARLLPAARLRLVAALRGSGAVVALTGSGPADGPALHAAHVGVALGRHGTELARQAAALVLVDDDLQHLVAAVAQGRLSYHNLQKAVAYLVALHLACVLAVAVPLLAAWPYPDLLGPLHLLLLELVLGPACVLAFESEPAEPGQMQCPPRPPGAALLGGPALRRSLWQGLGLAGAALGVHYGAMQQGAPAPEVRTLVFTTLVLGNGLLVLAGRSFTQLALHTLRVPNRRLWLLLGGTLALLLAGLLVPAGHRLLGLVALAPARAWACLVAALLGVVGIELYKLSRRGGAGPPPAGAAPPAL